MEFSIICSCGKQHEFIIHFIKSESGKWKNDYIHYNDHLDEEIRICMLNISKYDINKIKKKLKT
jgi:hypothetical protein